MHILDTSQRCPLHCAAARGYTECVRVLLADEDVEVNIVDNDGNTPLSLAKLQKHTEIIKMLEAHGGIDLRPVRP